MKKYLLPFFSIFILLTLLFIGLYNLTSINIQPAKNNSDYINGKFVEALKIEFDHQVPIREKAISFWSGFKFSLFKEGSKGVLTGFDNWLFTSEEYEENLNDEMNREEFFNKIEEVNEYFEKKDLTLLVVLVPSKVRIYNEHITRFPLSEQLKSRYDRSIKQLENSGIQTVDLFRAFMTRKTSEQLFYKSDTHWTYEGAAITAAEIQKRIDPLIEYYGLSKRSYHLKEGNVLSFKGDLLDYVPSFKGQPEIYKEIEARDVNPPELGLFDSVEIPVILVGTSYSFDPRWNFDDALKLSLQIDVLNLSEEGKGPFPPMFSLMESEYFYEINSKIIIWEIPERYIPLY